MRIVGLDRDLPALPRTGMYTHRLQGDGKQTSSDLLTGGNDGIIFPCVVHRRCLTGPGHEFIGFPGHGGNNNGDLMSGINLAFDMPGHITDAVNIGHRSAAEFHHNACHGKVPFWDA